MYIILLQDEIYFLNGDRLIDTFLFKIKINFS